MVGIQQMLAHVMLLWRSFIELKNNSISTDCKQQRLTSANASEQVNVLEDNKAYGIGKRV